jgi:tRNA(fMet)-specific endonuclease VapC
MSGNDNLLLDTNIIIGLFANDTAILNQLAQSDDIFVPAIVLGELYYGAEKSGRVARNRQRIEQFTQANVILGIDATTATYYGRIKQRLQASGRPIPENDIWIAAIAQQYQLTLITRDQHFQHIAGLAVTSW